VAKVKQIETCDIAYQQSALILGQEKFSKQNELCQMKNKRLNQNLKCTTADSELFPTHDVVQQVFHLKWRKVEQVIRRFLPRAYQRA
jgi:hypothetical protein